MTMLLSGTICRRYASYFAAPCVCDVTDLAVVSEMNNVVC